MDRFHAAVKLAQPAPAMLTTCAPWELPMPHHAPKPEDAAYTRTPSLRLRDRAPALHKSLTEPPRELSARSPDRNRATPYRDDPRRGELELALLHAHAAGAKTLKDLTAAVATAKRRPSATRPRSPPDAVEETLGPGPVGARLRRGAGGAVLVSSVAAAGAACRGRAEIPSGPILVRVALRPTPQTGRGAAAAATRIVRRDEFAAGTRIVRGDEFAAGTRIVRGDESPAAGTRIARGVARGWDTDSPRSRPRLGRG